jgi:hypothetical protein
VEHREEPVDIIPAEKIAFIAYNIGVYESVQKFGALIVNGKISNEGSDVSKIAQLLSEANAFYDSEMISQLINTMVRNYHHDSSTLIFYLLVSGFSYITQLLSST